MASVMSSLGRIGFVGTQLPFKVFPNGNAQLFLHKCYASARPKNIEAPPHVDVAQLAVQARVSLSTKEVEDFTPKIAGIVEWFGQLQDIDLEDVEPAIRAADMDSTNNLRPDIPVLFDNRDSMISTIPVLEDPYIKVPKILKDNIE